MTISPQPVAQPVARSTALSPFASTAFLVLWIATLVSNIGTWMQNAAAGWLITTLSQDPFVISLVQVATMLPAVILGLPAGALADIVDRRLLLLAVNAAVVAIVAVLALMVGREAIGAVGLLCFTAAVGAAAALIAPAWQSIVPTLVPAKDLQPAVALNSVALNISRAIGPAFAGVLIGSLGMAAPFWINSISTGGVVVALLWWKPRENVQAALPPERFSSALRLGLRHAMHNPHLKSTLVRAGGFFVFASCYWALLPLIARERIGAGPHLYGLMLATIGVGAVAGAFALPRVSARIGANGLVAVATGGTCVALILFGVATTPELGFAACLLAGISWIAALAPMSVSAQVALPAWVKGRGLAIYGMVQFGSMAVGSAMWGRIAGQFGVAESLFIAAAGIIAALGLLWPLRLQTGAALDLSPSMHWPTPLVSTEPDPDHGPVQIQIEYEVDEVDRQQFLRAIARLRLERLRDGASAWNVFQDAAEPRRYVETFLVPSWREHERQHRRVAQADRVVQDQVRAFHRGSEPPVVRHLIAATVKQDA